jgi:predicted membrane-bound spermidine synthase
VREAPPWFLLAAAAATGAAVMTVEMSAVRTLQPFFGSTTPVWTNVIAVVLGALALGYALGGRIADRRPSATLLFGLLSSAGILVTAAAVAVTPVSWAFLARGVDLEATASLHWKGSLGATLVVFAPPLVLFGMVTPLAVRLLAAGGAGRAAGRVFAVSTTASIAGTYLPTFVLVPHLGSRGSLVVAAGMAIVPAAAGLSIFGGRRSRFAAAAVVAAAALVAGLADLRPARGAPVFDNGGVANVLAERESAYQYLTVREDTFAGGEIDRVLTMNEAAYSFHSLKVRGQVLTDSRHYDDYTVLPMLLDLAPGADLRLGVVGFACGVNAGQWRHFWDGPYRLRVDGAELDPEIVDLGREFFDLPAAEDPRVRVAVADGRVWLASLPEDTRYHVLLVDAFANEIYMPFHLGTREFLELCRRRLEPGGVLAMNVYAVGEDAPNLAAIENTVATVFGACVRSSRYGGRGFLLIAADGGPPDLARLDPESVRRRFGDREGVAEWDRLLDLAAEVSDDVAMIEPRPGARVLTDDDAPLEYLTDRFVRDEERRILDGAEDGEALRHRDRLRALSRRQDRTLAGVAAAWAVVLLLALFTVRRA